jgi:hypothetical protein
MVKIKMNEFSNDKKIPIAFAGTFAFLPTLDLTQKKTIEPASQRTGTVQT